MFIICYRLLLCRPNNIEDYIHRIGRTGRAGAHGLSVSFFTNKAARMAKDLIEILEMAKQEVPSPLLAMSRDAYGGGGGGGGRGGHGGRRY
jgi:ATP-dependent RNA helicase DDX5/DBP2